MIFQPIQADTCWNNAVAVFNLSLLYEEPYQSRYSNECFYWLILMHLAIDGSF